VGPVKARFAGKVTLDPSQAPDRFTLTGEGSGGIAGFAKGGADVTLTEDGPESTILTYVAKAQVGGKLAQIGGRLVDATAKQMADQFFSAFAEKVGGGAAAAQPEDIGEEAVLADVEKDPEVTAEAIEERLEVAAGRGFLGGPYVWGLLALLAIIVLILIFR